MQDKFLNRSKSSTYQRWFWIKTRVEASTYVQRNVLNKNMGRFTKLTYQGKFFKGNKLRKVLSGNRRVVLRKVISYHWENVMGIDTNVCHFLFQVLNQLAHLKINVKDSFNRYKAFCVLSPELPRLGTYLQNCFKSVFKTFYLNMSFTDRAVFEIWALWAKSKGIFNWSSVAKVTFCVRPCT